VRVRRLFDLSFVIILRLWFLLTQSCASVVILLSNLILRTNSSSIAMWS
jgi:hypothetical protein